MSVLSSQWCCILYGTQLAGAVVSVASGKGQIPLTVTLRHRVLSWISWYRPRRMLLKHLSKPNILWKQRGTIITVAYKSISTFHARWNNLLSSYIPDTIIQTIMTLYWYIISKLISLVVFPSVRHIKHAPKCDSLKVLVLLYICNDKSKQVQASKRKLN